jgi:4-hydroxy-tetrahydrodipicolinate synthase
MTASNTLSGVFTPVVTPFKADLSVDAERFLALCRWLLSQGAGLAVFGTNSEANSLSLRERLSLLDYLVDHGIDPRRMMPGTGCCSLEETVQLTNLALRRGCGGVLMLPPFFYKGVSDDGLFDFYARVIDRVASSDLRVYLYHIPQVSGVPISYGLIERLLKAYAGVVVGLKDSSGDWANTEGMLKRFPGFAVFPASESLLERALPLGAAGCISATANIQPGPIARLIEQFGTAGSEQRQAGVSAVRSVLQAFLMIPALKAVIAARSDDDAWMPVRPPLTGLTSAQAQDLLARLAALDFEMPQWKREPA